MISSARLLTILFVTSLLFSTVWSLNSAASSPSNNWQAKVDPTLLAEIQNGRGLNPTAEFLIVLREQADLEPAYALTSKEEKGRYVYEQLTSIAQSTQAQIITQLETEGTPHRPFWITNMIWAKGDLETIQRTAARNDVFYLYPNPVIELDYPQQEENLNRSTQSIEWNITKINADDVWAAGFTGQGAVVAGQDTGYNWDHAAILNQYRGWNGITATHDYNWHDAIASNNVYCSGNSVEPCDDHGHGTHTMGTVVGNDLDPTDPNWPENATNAVGVAPGAEWIACRNMNRGAGTPATYTECYEWFIAPYPYGGDPMTDGDPSQAPHVINNSWACTIGEGCGANTLLAVVQAVRAAGIVTAHSNGNNGSGCNSVFYPSAIYDESFSVGSTTSGDSISSFSSRGPVTIDGSGRMKPDISAPGSSVRSAHRSDGSYTYLSGTSMAAPHIAGVVALLISAEPRLAGNVDLIEHIIQESAVPLTTTQGCGGDSSTAVPNNVFGHGRVDAYAALQYLQQLQTIDPQLTITAPDTVYQVDSFANFTTTLTYSYQITNSNYFTPFTDLTLSNTLPISASFITATHPFTLENGSPPTLTWHLGTLSPTTSTRLTLTIQLTGSTNMTATINNHAISLTSNETDPVTHPPIITIICGAPLSPADLALNQNGLQASLDWNGYSPIYELWVSDSDPDFTIAQTDRCEESNQCVTLDHDSYQFGVASLPGQSYHYKVRGRSGCGAVSSGTTNSISTADQALLVPHLIPFPHQYYYPIVLSQPVN